MNRHNHTLSAVAASLLFFGVAGSAEALLIIDNPSFEAYDENTYALANWTGFPATDLDEDGFATVWFYKDNLPSVYDRDQNLLTRSADQAPLGVGRSFAFLSANGTLTQSGLEWHKGDSISFWYNFMANDYSSYNDFAVLTINSESVQLESVEGVVASVEGVGSYASTGWTQYTYEFTADAADGAGQIGFGVHNAVDDYVDSWLFVDDIRVTLAETDDTGDNGDTGDNASVPEPATIALLAAGLAGVASRRGGAKGRRSRAKAA